MAALLARTSAPTRLVTTLCVVLFAASSVALAEQPPHSLWRGPSAHLAQPHRGPFAVGEVVITFTAAQYLCSVSYEGEMAFAAVVGRSAHERIVAASCHYLNPASGMAEVAYMVDPEWQGSGLGRILHAGLVEYGRAHGARGLTADVLPGNTRMMRIFEEAITRSPSRRKPASKS